MTFRHSIELAGLGCGFRSTMRYVKLILCSVVSMLVFTACSSSPNSSTSASSAPDSAPAETSTSEVDDVLDYPWPDSEALDWIRPVYEKSKQFRGQPVEYPPIEPSEDNPHGYSVGQPNICNEEIQRRFETIGATYKEELVLVGAEWSNCVFAIPDPRTSSSSFNIHHVDPMFDIEIITLEKVAPDAIRQNEFNPRETCTVVEDSPNKTRDFFYYSSPSSNAYRAFTFEDSCQFSRIVRSIFYNVHGKN